MEHAEGASTQSLKSNPTVVKRDGRIVNFDKSKILNAVSKAFAEVSKGKDRDQASIESVVDAVVEAVANLEADEISVEQIQNIVILTLKSMRYTAEFKSYRTYRNRRNKARLNSSALYKKLAEITNATLGESNIRRENGNIDGDSSMGKMLRYGSESSKQYFLDNVIDEKFSWAHQDGAIHIHDLDFYGSTITCCQIDIEDLLSRGFNTGHGFVRSPQSIHSAACLAAIIIQSNQNDQHGGQAIPNFDYALAKYVKLSFNKSLKHTLNDHLIMLGICDETIADIDAKVFPSELEYGITEKSKFVDTLFDIYDVEISFADAKRLFELAQRKIRRKTSQAMEAFLFNLNTMHSRAGAQVPFSSINYGTDTTPEGRLVVDCMLDVTNDGLGHGETSIFPIQIFRVAEGVNLNEGDPNFDLRVKAMKISAKRFFPNWAFHDATFNKADLADPKTLISYMGCVAPESVISYKYNGQLHVESISRLFNRMPANLIRHNAVTEWIDTSGLDLTIWDSHSMDFVKVKTVLRNHGKFTWKKVTYSSGRILGCTDDHPLPIDGLGRTYVRDIPAGSSAAVSYAAVAKLPKGQSAYAPSMTVDFEEAAVRLLELNAMGFRTSLTEQVREDGTTAYMITADETGHDSVESSLLTITDAEYGEFSYDVETSSDYFDVNGIVSHNCRTRIKSDVNSDSPQTYSRGNLSFTTINLPRIGILSQGNWDIFYETLAKYLELVKDQLIERYTLQCKQKVKNFKFLMGQGVWIGSKALSSEDTLESVLKHGTLGIGFIGLAECLVAMTGHHHGEDPESQQRGLEIIKFMRDFCDKQTELLQLNFSLLGTPAEGLSGRFTKIDKQRFGSIPGITDKDFYTNSSHVPVDFECTIEHKLEVEGPYHELENGGHIFYCRIDGDAQQNIDAYDKIIRAMRDHNIGYGAVNIDVDTCTKCFHTGIIKDACPKCGARDEGNTIERIRRITGYLVGSLRNWNNGKLAEFNSRKNV